MRGCFPCVLRASPSAHPPATACCHACPCSLRPLLPPHCSHVCIKRGRNFFVSYAKNRGSTPPAENPAVAKITVLQAKSALSQIECRTVRSRVNCTGGYMVFAWETWRLWTHERWTTTIPPHETRCSSMALLMMFAGVWGQSPQGTGVWGQSPHPKKNTAARATSNTAATLGQVRDRGNFARPLLPRLRAQRCPACFRDGHCCDTSRGRGGRAPDQHNTPDNARRVSCTHAPPPRCYCFGAMLAWLCVEHQ